MEIKTNVVYQIRKGDSWRGKDNIDIKSNLDEEMVDCRISKSLVDYLIKESAILEPDKLLLNFAECQRRELELNLESLDDVTLRFKTYAEDANKRIMAAYEDSEKQRDELEKKFNATVKKFKNGIVESEDSIKQNMATLQIYSDSLTKIDNYGLDNLLKTIATLNSLIDKDRDLVKLVLEQKK